MLRNDPASVLGAKLFGILKIMIIYCTDRTG